jgi:hypothetical protein
MNQGFLIAVMMGWMFFVALTFEVRFRQERKLNEKKFAKRRRSKKQDAGRES